MGGPNRRQDARCGGGYFPFLTRFDRKHRVAAVLEKLGGQVVPFQFENRGLLTWTSASRPRAGGRRSAARSALREVHTL